MNTNLVKLRALKKSDSDLFYKWITNKELVLFNAAYKPVSEFDHEKWIESVIQKRTDMVLFVIEDSKTSNVIGSCQLMHIDLLHRNAELQIRIGETASHSKGLGTDALKQLVVFGFTHLNLHRIYLHVFANNERAIKAYLKTGFTVEGSLREAAFINGKYVDIVIMSLIKQDIE
jgi:RimJ/RimL family protein N-acetyltransferase